MFCKFERVWCSIDYPYQLLLHYIITQMLLYFTQ